MSLPDCPRCDKNRFVLEEPVMLLSMPPKQEYFCQQCHYSWHVVSETYTAKESEHESES